MMVRPFLTDEQIEVLRLRMRGLSQKEIAEILKTTRANVCIIEKRARRNIERALKTIEIWKKINSRAEIEIPSGTDLMDIPQIIFEKANENDVKVKYSFLELIEHIKGPLRLMFLHLQLRKLFNRLYLRSFRKLSDVSLSQSSEIDLHAFLGSHYHR
ncbi:MAG: HTH-type transcriptional regulator, fmd operon transcriptional regulator [Archaeoglobi archaeon]|nr:HTH-type transcriptional regulator, fmd operon transcriptional regulator [Archaeoglobi archaeon]